MTADEQLEVIRQRVDRQALREQLGEECGEVVQMLFKSYRANGNGNPTPLSVEQVETKLQEEVCDLIVCLAALDYFSLGELADDSVIAAKVARWVQRLEAAKEGK